MNSASLILTYIAAVIRAAWQLQAQLTLHLDLVDVCQDPVRHGLIMREHVVIVDSVKSESGLDGDSLSRLWLSLGVRGRLLSLAARS